MARPRLSHTPGSGCARHGFHRVESARRAGIKTLDVTVTQGTLLDAQWMSYSANKSHGLRRSNAEKQAAVQNAIKHQRGVPLGDRAIAEHVGVDHQTVANWRKKLSASVEIRQMGEKRQVNRGGKNYTINTAPIAKSNTMRSPTAKKLKVGQVVLQLLTDNHPLSFTQVFDWLVMQWDGCPLAHLLR